MNKNDELFITEAYSGQCEHPNCQNQGFRYEYLREVEVKEKKLFVIACPIHAKYFGLCYRCGEYARGDHNLDWCDGRLRDPCMSTLNNEMFPMYHCDFETDYRS